MKCWKKARRKAISNLIRQIERKEQKRKSIWYRIKKVLNVFIGK